VGVGSCGLAGAGGFEEESGSGGKIKIDDGSRLRTGREKDSLVVVYVEKFAFRRPSTAVAAAAVRRSTHT